MSYIPPSARPPGGQPGQGLFGGDEPSILGNISAATPSTGNPVQELSKTQQIIRGLTKEFTELQKQFQDVQFRKLSKTVAEFKNWANEAERLTASLKEAKKVMQGTTTGARGAFQFAGAAGPPLGANASGVSAQHQAATASRQGRQQEEVTQQLSWSQRMRQSLPSAGQVATGAVGLAATGTLAAGSYAARHRPTIETSQLLQQISAMGQPGGPGTFSARAEGVRAQVQAMVDARQIVGTGAEIAGAQQELFMSAGALPGTARGNALTQATGRIQAVMPGTPAPVAAQSVVGMQNPQITNQLYLMGIIPSAKSAEDPIAMGIAVIKHVGYGRIPSLETLETMRNRWSPAGKRLRQLLGNDELVIQAAISEAIAEKTGGAARTGPGVNPADEIARRTGAAPLARGRQETEAAWATPLLDSQDKLVEGFTYMDEKSRDVAKAFEEKLLPSIAETAAQLSGLGSVLPNIVGMAQSALFYFAGRGRRPKAAATAAETSAAKPPAASPVSRLGKVGKWAGRLGKVGAALLLFDAVSNIFSGDIPRDPGMAAVDEHLRQKYPNRYTTPEGDPPTLTNTMIKPFSGPPIGDPATFEGIRTDKDASHITGMKPILKDRLRAMFAANPRLYVYSGYRSIAHQDRLFKQKVREVGSVAKARKTVAPPGKSNHNFGLAADLAPRSELGWVKANMRRFGLELPMSYEPWHVEPIGTRSGGEKVALEMAGGQQNAAQETVQAQEEGTVGAGGGGGGGIPDPDEAVRIAAALGGGMTVGGKSLQERTSATGDAGEPGAVAAGDAGAPVGGDIEKYLYGLRWHESGVRGGNYTARSKVGSASGAYQYIDKTWARYRGFARAYLAPPPIQDERARRDSSGYFSKYKDWRKVAVMHFTGDAALASDPSKWNRKPGHPSNPTINSYVQSVMSKAGLGDPPTLDDMGPRPGSRSTPRAVGGSFPGGLFGSTTNNINVTLHIDRASQEEAERFAKYVITLLERDRRLNAVARG